MSVVNKREYIYGNALVLANDGNTPVIIGEDGYLYKNGSPVSDFNNIKMFSSNMNAMIALDKDGNVYIGTDSIEEMGPISSLSNVVWVAAGHEIATYMAITKDHKLYGWGRNFYGSLGIGNRSTVGNPTLITLPNDEIPFMVTMFDQQAAVLTMEGNVYFAGNDQYYTSNLSIITTNWTKLNISHVTYICGSNGTDNALGLYMIKDDGTMYIVGSEEYRGPTPHKIDGIENAHVCWGNNSTSVVVVTNDNKAYNVTVPNIVQFNMEDVSVVAVPRNDNHYTIVNTNEKVFTISDPTATPVFSSMLSTSVKPLSIQAPDFSIEPIYGSYTAKNGNTYYYRTTFTEGYVSYDAYGSPYSSKVVCKLEYGPGSLYGTLFRTDEETFTINNYDNYRTILRERATTQSTLLKDYLDRLIGTVNVPSTKYDALAPATNGLTYYIRTQFIRKASSNVKYELIIQTEYDDDMNYRNVYDSKEILINSDNYNDYQEIIETESNRQIMECKELLNKLIDTIEIPEPVEEEYKTKSGKIFFIKTIYNLERKTDFEAEFSYKTVYGPNTDYEYQYDLEQYIVINAEAYKNHQLTLKQIAENQIRLCKDEKFRPWNISIPESLEKEYINQGGAKYYIKITYSQGETTDNENIIKYTATYGDTYIGNIDKIYSEKTHIINQGNYAIAQEDLNNLGLFEFSLMESSLDIPNMAENIPEDKIKIYTKNGVNYELRIKRTAGALKNVVNSTPYLDGSLFDITISSSFLYSVQEALDELDELADTQIESMEKILEANTPDDFDGTYSNGDCHYHIKTLFLKTAGNKTINIRTISDGNIFKLNTQSITPDNIFDNLGEAKTKGLDDLQILMDVIKAGPTNVDNTYSVGNINYNVKCTYLKEKDDPEIVCESFCDNNKYDTDRIYLYEEGSTLQQDLAYISTRGESQLVNMRKLLLDSSPKDTIEIATYNGFRYNIGIGFIKEAGSTVCTAGAMIDGEMYGAYTNKLIFSSITVNTQDLTQAALASKEIVISRISKSPKNTYSPFTIHSFNYGLETTYIKEAGSHNVTINTLLDGRIFKSVKNIINTNTLVDDLNNCIVTGTNGIQELQQILQKSPPNSDEDQYVISGFYYYAGVIYDKQSGGNVVNIKIILDGNIKEDYNESIMNTNPGDDIDRIIEESKTKVRAILNTLRGLDPEEYIHKVNGFSFKISVTYQKNTIAASNTEDRATIIIRSFIDDVKTSGEEVYTFNTSDIDKYRQRGLEIIEELKTKLNDSPKNLQELYQINGFIFKVGANFDKEAGDTNVTIHRVLDDNILPDPITTTFDITRITEIARRGHNEVVALKEQLNIVPEDYEEEYIVGTMGFNVGSEFSKEYGFSTVRIITTIDGEQYGEVTTTNFDINKIEDIKELALNKEAMLKKLLDTVPNNSTEVFNHMNYSFNIEKCYIKNPGDKNYMSMIKLDGRQFGSYSSSPFRIYQINNIESFNNAEVERLKYKIQQTMSDDIHTTFAKSGFNFMIDIYFRKKPGTNKIIVDYTIDSANLRNTTTEG